MSRLDTFLRTYLFPRRLGEMIAGSEEQVILLTWAGTLGAMGAVAACGLRALADAILPFLWGAGGDISRQVALAPTWMRLVIPAAGGVIAGLILVYGVKITRAASGWGILEAVVLRDGMLNFRPALVKTLSSLVTITTGGSVGREGPMVLISSTLASKAGQWLKLPTRHLRILTASGVASGMAAAYNAPIGAAFFAMEIILGNFAMEVFAPLVFASVIATLVSRGLYGAEPIFHVPSFEMVSIWEVGFYLLLGLAGGLLASAFLGALRFFSRCFQTIRLSRPLAMGLTGGVLGVVILWHPEICGNGRVLTDALLGSSYGWRLAATLLVLKLLLTTMTVGSGAVGGVFTPSLFVGGAMGYGFGTLVHFLAPAYSAQAPAYALVGMGCLLAGTAQAPIMATLMIFEMSLNYSIVLPLMLSCAAASLVARAVSPRSVYTEALRRKGAPVTTPEAQVMTSLTVRDIMRSDYETVPPDCPLPKVLDSFIKGRRNHLYVVDRDGRFLGALGLHDLKETLKDAEEVSFVIALDLMRPSFEMTVPGERLDQVMERFWAQDCERIPVVADLESRRLVGTVSKRDILGVYTLEVLHRKSLMTHFKPADRREGEESTFVELPARYRVDGIEVGESLAGQTVAEARLRDRFGVMVLMICRKDRAGKEMRMVPEPTTRFLRGDRLVVFGPAEGLEALRTR
ncbi:MAG: ClcB-like voltage-gated chloride channel protein [Acidobacteriota bacterium]